MIALWTLLTTLHGAAAPLIPASPARRFTADTADCTRDLAALDAKIRADYAGFLLEIRGRRLTAYQQHLAALRGRAAHTAGDSCYFIYRDLVTFFDDPHLFIWQNPAIDSTGAARNRAAVQRLPLSEVDAHRYFDAHRGALDPIEGIWFDEGLRVAILTPAGATPGHFVAVVLQADTAGWEPGMVRAEFTRTARGYDGVLSARNFATRFVAPELYRHVLLRLAPGIWGKAYPVAPADTGLVDGFDPHRAVYAVRDGTPVLAIPSHDPRYQPWLDSLLAAHHDELMRARELVIDLRGNEGGSSGMTNALLPFVVSDRQRPPFFPTRANQPDQGKGMMLSSSDQLRYAVAMVGADSTDPSAQRFLARMRANPGRLVQFADTLDPPSRPAPPAKPSVGPRHVGILVDHGTVSAAETFLVEAMRSTRVTVFGEPTEGALDYETVSIVRFQAGGRLHFGLGYPTITSQPDLPRNGIRGKGIPPQVRLDLRHDADPIGRVVERLREGT